VTDATDIEMQREELSHEDEPPCITLSRTTRHQTRRAVAGPPAA